MKIDRLIGILTILLQKDRITTPELAKKFEVSRRTISRDIDALARAGIPIISHQGNGGGISIAEGYKIDNNVFTTDELSNMVAALKGIGSISEKSNTERILDKLNANAVISMCEPIIIDLASHYKGELTNKIELIKNAVLDNKIIKFDYIYKKGESQQSIEPYFVIFQWSSWYVFGFCLERLDFRLFKLNRLWNLHVIDKNFTPRQIPSEKRDFESWIYEKKENKLIAVFDVSEKYQLIETYGPNCYKEIDDGLLFEIGFKNRDYILSWLLGFGSKVKVLEPKYIIADLQVSAENILNRYK